MLRALPPEWGQLVLRSALQMPASLSTGGRDHAEWIQHTLERRRDPEAAPLANAAVLRKFGAESNGDAP